MLKVAKACGVDADKAELHFVKGPPKDLVIVRGASVYDGYKKIKGKVLKVDVPQHLSNEMQELNTFLEGFTLGHGTHRGFFRSYNNGDRSGFDFDRGARLYSAGEDNLGALSDSPESSKMAWWNRVEYGVAPRV